MNNENTPLDAPNISQSSAKPNKVLRVFSIISWVFEGFFGLITFLGIFFKAQSWEGGNEILVLGISCLLLLYFVLLWSISGSRTWIQGLMTIPIGIAMVFSLASVLFRRESWEGASEMAIIGFMLLVLCMIGIGVAMAIFYKKSDNKAYYWHILIRAIVIALLTAPGFFSAFG